MPKSSWSICVSGTIRVPTKRFCLPWFPRFDFFFHSTPSSPLENYSTTKLSDSPWNGHHRKPVSRSLRYRRRSLLLLFFLFLEKKNSDSFLGYSSVHSWTGTEDYLAASDGFIRLIGPWGGKIESAEAWQDGDFRSASLLNRITWVKW